MAAQIKIRRSTGSAIPTGLVTGELAYSGATATDNGNTAGVLYIGSPANGNAIAIGGSKYVNLLSATAGTAAASKAVILDASNGITGLGAVSANTVTVNYVTAGNVEITTLTAGNVQISTNTVTTTGVNQDLVLNPNGTGKIKLYDLYTLPDTNGTEGYVLTTDGAGNTSWQASSSSLSLAGNTGTGTVNLLNQVFTVTGSGGISTSASGNTLSLSLASSLSSLAGLSVTADQLIIGSGANTFTTFATGATGRDLLQDATVLYAKTTLSLVPGVNVQAWSSSLDALAAKTSTGYMVQTGANTYTSRSIQGSGDVAVANGDGVSGNTQISVTGNLKGLQDSSGTGIYVKTSSNTGSAVTLTSNSGDLTITNGDGVAGNPTFALANNLLGVSGVANNGFYVRTGANTAVAREITGTTNRIVVTNGDGVASSPTIDLASVANSGNGTFLKVEVDGYGRVTGTTAVTTGDITALANGVYVNVDGDTMTGNLTFTNSATVTGLPAPVNSGDAANKSYVDSIAAGLSWKQAVQAATTGAITLSGTQTIDGFAVTVGDRVLVKNQGSGADNGIYVVASGAWARASDADTFTELNGAAVFVMNGSTNGDTGWVQTAALTSLSTPQVWNQFTGGGALTGGTGITISGATINFNPGLGLEAGANNTIQVNTNATNSVQIVGSEVALVLASGSGLAQSANGLTINAASVTNAMLQNPSLSLDADTGTGTVALGGTLNIIGTSSQGVSTSTANSDVTITVADATTTTKGVASFSANNFAVASGVVTIKDGGVDLASNTVTGTLPVSKGGTGAATFTAGRLLIGDGTNPITTDAELTFDGANNIITIGTATLQGGTTDVTLTATATNGDINLVPNGTGTVNIGSTGSGTIASSSGQTLTVTGDAGLTLGATSNDITMTLANANTAKVTISGPSSNTYAEAMGLNDLVNRDFVENYAVIDGGTY